MTIEPGEVTEVDRQRSFAELEAGLRSVPIDPDSRGRVTLIVSRPEPGERKTPDVIHLTPDGGVPGDHWARKEGATIESQITVMQTAVARLIANGRPLSLFGDNLFLELDLSAENLPVGSRVAVGGAVLEVTPKPHKGCAKFSGRFGLDALRFVATPEGRRRRLRGLYMRVVEAGEVRPGDAVSIVERGPASV